MSVWYACSGCPRPSDGVRISMSRKGEPTENGHVERLMRTIKEEEVALSNYDGYADARSQIGTFLDGVYRHKRVHSALGYLTPIEQLQRLPPTFPPLLPHTSQPRIPARTPRAT